LFALFPAAPAWAKQQRQLATLLSKGVVERAPTGYRLAAGVRAQVQGGTPTDPCWSCRQDRADTSPLAPCPHCGAEPTPL